MTSPAPYVSTRITVTEDRYYSSHKQVSFPFWILLLFPLEGAIAERTILELCSPWSTGSSPLELAMKRYLKIAKPGKKKKT